MKSELNGKSKIEKMGNIMEEDCDWTADEKIKFLSNQMIKMEIRLFEVERQLGIVPKEHD